MFDSQISGIQVPLKSTLLYLRTRVMIGYVLYDLRMDFFACYNNLEFRIEQFVEAFARDNVIAANSNLDRKR